ncbi:MAG TPA: S9 family peptidase [Thermoanaerobaculia bacterium]|nr:S9 family peptidase [Thermoanaerobaculia bacterium]
MSPPIAPARPTRTSLHGEELVDEYAWLRDRDDPAVRAHLEAENRYAAAVLAGSAALEEELYQEMLWRLQENDSTVPVRRGSWWYYQRSEEGRQHPIHARRRGGSHSGGPDPDAPEQVVLDVNRLAAGHPFLHVATVLPSPDHRLLAFTVDDNGDERLVVRFRDLATGRLLPDVLPEAGYELAWAADGRTLFYLVRDDRQRPWQVRRHAVGGEPADDPVVLEEDDDAFFLHVETTRDGRWVLLASASSITRDVWFVPAARPAEPPRRVMPRRSGVETFVESHDGSFYLTTNLGHPEHFATRAPAGEVDPSRWEIVVPPRPDVRVEAVHAFARHLVIQLRRGGLRRFRIRDLDPGTGAPPGEREVELPERLYGAWCGDNPEADSGTFRLHYSSFVTPPSVYDVDLATGAPTLRKRTEVLGGYDPGRYRTARLYARAPDGMAVPVDVVHRRGLELDGSHPALLAGYGAYGESLEPLFTVERLSLLDRGFVFALSHGRGGGELGESWHEQGRMLAKPNTFTDFLAVAEHLVEVGYTAPERLAIRGRSAGGLLVAAAVNRRPELFAAVVAHVPFVDVLNTMRDPSIPFTALEHEEWGDPREEAVYRVMRTYSPYENVGAHRYPPMLVTSGWHDTRVHYWEPAKWVARLRARAGERGGGPILLETDFGAGHAGAAGRYDALRQAARESAFLLCVLGGGDPAHRGGPLDGPLPSNRKVLTCAPFESPGLPGRGSPP